MTYLSEILGYLSWPAIIILSYVLVRWALRVFERNRQESGQEQ